MHSAPIQAALPGFAPSALLSRTDLSDIEAAKDCIHELDHCRDDLQFARWAMRWGPAISARLLDRESEDRVAAAEQEATEAEESFGRLEKAVEDAVKALDTAIDGERPALVDKINAITADLENAL